MTYNILIMLIMSTFTESITSFLPFWIMKGFNNLFHISLFFFSGIDFKMKTISLGGKTIKVQIWWLLSLDSTKNKLK